MEGRTGSDVFGEEVGVLPHAIAGALDLNDHGVMEEPVEQRGGDNGIAEHISPLGEAAVRGQDHRALFISGVDELEEQVAAWRRPAKPRCRRHSFRSGMKGAMSRWCGSAQRPGRNSTIISLSRARARVGGSQRLS